MTAIQKEATQIQREIHKQRVRTAVAKLSRESISNTAVKRADGRCRVCGTRGKHGVCPNCGTAVQDKGLLDWR